MDVGPESVHLDGALPLEGRVTVRIAYVIPAYPLMIAGEPAWGGHEATLGWQLVQVDLTPYVGEIVRLRFAFHSDNSSAGPHPGVFIDDFYIN